MFPKIFLTKDVCPEFSKKLSSSVDIGLHKQNADNYNFSLQKKKKNEKRNQNSEQMC